MTRDSKEVGARVAPLRGSENSTETWWTRVNVFKPHQENHGLNRRLGPPATANLSKLNWAFQLLDQQW
jgi:hypothetical protein